MPKSSKKKPANKLATVKIADLSPSQQAKPDAFDPRHINHYDELTLTTCEILGLAQLIREIGSIDHESTTNTSVLLEGCAAVAQVIMDKTYVIDKHAKALRAGGAR